MDKLRGQVNWVYWGQIKLIKEKQDHIKMEPLNICSNNDTIKTHIEGWEIHLRKYGGDFIYISLKLAPYM